MAKTSLVSNALIRLNLLFLSTIALLGWTIIASAHGSAHLRYRQESAIQIEALHDNGKPMINAEVRVYAPENHREPWLVGNTDGQGQFRFIPQAGQIGSWTVTVSQLGHSHNINIPIQQNLAVAAAQTSSTYSPMQKLTMAVVGIWGFLGTALYFTRNSQKT